MVTKYRQKHRCSKCAKSRKLDEEYKKYNREYQRSYYTNKKKKRDTAPGVVAASILPKGGDVKVVGMVANNEYAAENFGDFAGKKIPKLEFVYGVDAGAYNGLVVEMNNANYMIDKCKLVLLPKSDVCGC